MSQTNIFKGRLLPLFQKSYYISFYAIHNHYANFSGVLFFVFMEVNCLD
jgi:hypothetical protein